MANRCSGQILAAAEVQLPQIGAPVSMQRVRRMSHVSTRVIRHSIGFGLVGTADYTDGRASQAFGFLGP